MSIFRSYMLLSSSSSSSSSFFLLTLITITIDLFIFFSAHLYKKETNTKLAVEAMAVPAQQYCFVFVLL